MFGKYYTRMKTFLIALITLLLFSSICLSQNEQISVKPLWDELNNGNSSTRVNAAKLLRSHFDSESFDTLRKIGEILFFYGIDNHYPPAIEYGKVVIAEYYINSGRENEGINLSKGVLAAIQERGDYELLADNYRIIATGYKKIGDGNSTYLWAKKAIEVSKRSADKEEQVRGYPLLAEAFLLRGKTNDALTTYASYVKKCIRINDQRRLSSAYSRIGDIHRINGKINDAANYFQLSFQAAEKTKLTTPIGHAINNLAITYFEKGDTLKAKDYFYKSYKIREKTNNYVNICESLFNIGEYYYYTNQPKLAIEWYEKSRVLASEENIMQAEADALKCLATVCKEMGDFKAATIHLESMFTLLNKIKKENSTSYEDLTKLQLEIWKSDFDFQNYEKKDKQRMLVITSLFALCVLLIGLLIFTMLRNKKKQAKTVAEGD